ncbi:hypothetical protein CCH79_00019745 [Gambusia affinis]|uniref:Uncharacterized protein n=1 Tax=Gambusia affinis TaxID=33528 RepID=A0A315VF10_GAMAF|nr:hypothetical protein CCH79_00019745 [Gambusia affinis]
MAITQADKMLSSLWCSICFSVLALSGGTLHLHQERRYTLPQNRGFFTVGANLDVFARDGRGSAAPALPLAAQVASGSGAQREHRSRRSAGKSAMPKVYGQVKQRTMQSVNNGRRVGGIEEVFKVFYPLAQNVLSRGQQHTIPTIKSIGAGLLSLPETLESQLE